MSGWLDVFGWMGMMISRSVRMSLGMRVPAGLCMDVAQSAFVGIRWIRFTFLLVERRWRGIVDMEGRGAVTIVGLGRLRAAARLRIHVRINMDVQAGVLLDLADGGVRLVGPRVDVRVLVLAER